MIVALAWVLRCRPVCKRMRLQGLIERGTRLDGAERLFAVGWVALGLHSTVALLGCRSSTDSWSRAKDNSTCVSRN